MTMYDDIVATTLRNRGPEIAESLVTPSALNKLLYGDTQTYSRWEKFVMRQKNRIKRVRDAWLVLTGQAHIGEW